MTTASAGWHPDPQTPGMDRYWSGSEWTDERRPTPAPPPQQDVVRVSDKSGKPAQATIAWIIGLCTFGYMIPWAIAATRGKANAGSIGWLNLFLGWTVIGWIIALVMACGSHQSSAVVVNR